MSQSPDMPPVGVPQQIAPQITRVLAPNASPMTYWGTNSYLLGDEALAVIDPGPNDPAHLRALIAAIGDRPVEAIFVTHSHVDHSPLSAALAAQTGAPVYAFGDSRAGQSPVMQRLAAEGLTSGGEGVDPDFTPDRLIGDEETVIGTGWSLQALHTPGHFGNHLCYATGDALFCGDHVMGWASSLVSPPDGDLTDFMASCHRLSARRWGVFYPGHGAPIEAPAERLAWLIAHREAREAQLIEALRDGGTLASLTDRVYADLAPQMHPAAARNLFAHLIDLHGRGKILADPQLGEGAVFSLPTVEKM